MRKNTFRLVFLLTLILILGIFILLQNFSHSIFNKNPETPFKNLNKQEINEVSIQGEISYSKIYKDKNNWVLQKDGFVYTADKDRIDSIINGFIDLKKEEIASNNKNKHEVLGIGRKKITLKSKNKQYILYIGNASNITKNYLRIDEDNEVFVGSGFNDVFLNEDYRNLQVHFIADEEKITEIGITYDNQQLSILKRNNEWYSGETKFKKDRVDFFLSDLKSLNASDVFIKNPIENLYLPESLVIKVKEGGIHKSAFFYLKDKDYILKTSISNTTFQISDVYVSSLKKQEKDFTE